MFHLNDLNPVKAVTKVAKAVDSAVDTATGWVGHQAGNVKDKAVDIGYDSLTIANQLHVPGANKLADAVTHPVMEAKERQALLTAARDPARAELRWSSDKKLGDARNAHRTNTAEEMREALKGDFESLEGDIRMSKGPDGTPIPVMAHDDGNFEGMTMDEWMAIGAASGRVLKMDFKEPEAVQQAIALAKKHGVPDERLMFNLGSSETRLFRQARREFPGAIMAVNPPAHATAEELAKAATFAKELGGKVIFPIEYDDVNPTAVKALEGVGDVAVWNSPKGQSEEELAEMHDRLRAMGVHGMIDLRGERHVGPFSF